MKRLITGALGAVGLAPSGQVARAKAEGDRAAQKLRDLEARVASLKADADTWKRRHDEVSRRAAEQQDALAKAIARAERAEARAEELKARGDELQAEAKEMRARMQDSGRAAATVREHLMATETKLDLIEAALQVLDARTRAAGVPPPAEKLRT
jgi:chromosome segregation ATPase